MLKFLSDENFNNDLIKALVARSAEIDVIRAQDVGLYSAPDEEVLAWAANQGRIVLTQDRATFPRCAFERVLAGQPMPGVIVSDQHLSFKLVVDDLFLIAVCSVESECSGRVLYLPL